MSALALAPTADLDVAFTPEQARAHTDSIKVDLAALKGAIVVAFQRGAHQALGYGAGLKGWQSYCATEFADLARLALPVQERRAAVIEMRTAKMSTRAIAAGLGVSVGTVSADTTATESLGEVISLDGRQRDAQAASTTAGIKTKPVKALTTRAEEELLKAGPGGLTSAELGRRLRVHHGRISATLTRLEQQHRAYRSGDKREGFSPYVHPQHLVLEAELVD